MVSLSAVLNVFTQLNLAFKRLCRRLRQGDFARL